MQLDRLTPATMTEVTSDAPESRMEAQPQPSPQASRDASGPTSTTPHASARTQATAQTSARVGYRDQTQQGSTLAQHAGQQHGSEEASRGEQTPRGSTPAQDSRERVSEQPSGRAQAERRSVVQDAGQQREPEQPSGRAQAQHRSVVQDAGQREPQQPSGRAQAQGGSLAQDAGQRVSEEASRGEQTQRGSTPAQDSRERVSEQRGERPQAQHRRAAQDRRELVAEQPSGRAQAQRRSVEQDAGQQREPEQPSGRAQAQRRSPAQDAGQQRVSEQRSERPQAQHGRAAQDRRELVAEQPSGRTQAPRRSASQNAGQQRAPEQASRRALVVVAAEDSLPGGPTLSPGARGPSVTDAQNLLLRAGHSLTRFGADGQFGAETAAAVSRFQTKHGLRPTGQLDAATLQALAEAPPASPDYRALFADGVLRGVLAVGFDESGAQRPEQDEVRAGLAARGFHEVTPEERRALGLDEQGLYLTRTFERGGAPARVLLELVTPDLPDAKERFAAALRTQELVLYGGHGRYGSGPDFDDIHSPGGNFVVGAPFEPGHVTLGPNDLDAAPLLSAYQLMFFDGCNTFRYFDDFRARQPGKSERTLDLLGSNDELYWSATAENLLAALDAFSDEQDLEQLLEALDAINGHSGRAPAFRPDGFDDN